MAYLYLVTNRDLTFIQSVSVV